MTYRVMQKFWLDLEKPQEEEINNLIDHYKRGRQFSRIIRDGIRLMWSLGRGNLDVLFELFPWVLDEFYQRALAQKPGINEDLADQLTRLERLLLEQGNILVSDTKTPSWSTSRGPKPLPVSTVPGATLDDDIDNSDALVVTKKAASGMAAQNFINSISRLQ